MQDDNPRNLTDLQRIAVTAAEQKAQRDAFDAKLNASKIAEEEKARAIRAKEIEAMGNQNTIMQPTPLAEEASNKSPILRGIGGAVQNVGDVVGLGGVGLLNVAKNIAENVLWDEKSKVVGGIIDNYNKYLENRPLGRLISGGGGVPGNPQPSPVNNAAKPPAAPPVAPVDTTLTMGDARAAALGPNVVVKNRNKELYDAINRLDDASFIRFMKDNPEIPGLGFVKGDDGRMVRFAENPDNKKREPMSPIQMDATAKMLAAAGHLQAGIGARENAAATKQATADYRQEMLWERSNKNVQDLINILGKNPNTDQVDPQLAYYKMKRDNLAIPSTMNKEDRKSVQAAMDTAYAPVQRWINEYEAGLAKSGKPRKATPEEIFSITQKYEKKRGWSF